MKIKMPTSIDVRWTLTVAIAMALAAAAGFYLGYWLGAP